MKETPEIVQLGADVLRRQALAVDDFSCPEFHSLIDAMHQVMQQGNGVGIAAPQIDVSLQVLIIASRPTKRYPNAPEMAPLVMVNPRSHVLDDVLVKDWEGCLSVPGIRALVPRFQALQVEYQDAQGLTCQIELQGFPARVFQHEYDHLQGLVYLDRVENNRDIISETEFLKRIAA